MSVSTLVTDFLSSDAEAESPAVTQLPAELAQLIIQHRANLLDIVRASGEYLTSDDDKRRGRGISLLARVIAKCPKEAATRQETRTLAEFFTSCISNPLSEQVFVPTLQGLTSLAKLPYFGPVETTTICKAIFKHVDLHGRPQTTRFLVYCLMDVLVAQHRQALKRLGRDFLSGYCQLVTGEKDPRNLRLAFSIERVLLVEFDISESVEDLFDVIFCYFPITFTPPPNDPYGITSEQLQASLRACLAATPKFGPLALPLFMEKLQASATNAKRQTLEALAACFPVYGRAVILPEAQRFWEALSIEIFQAADGETEVCALRALKVFLATLFPDEGENPSLPQDKALSIYNTLRDTCLLELKDADKTSATAASKILAQAVAASGLLARTLVPSVFEYILSAYKSPDRQQQRSALFLITGKLIKALQVSPGPSACEALSVYREEIMSLAASGLGNSATQENALLCLTQLAQFPDCLSHQELVFAIQCITDLLVKPALDANNDIAASALDALESLVQQHPSDIEEITLPPLMQLLPDATPRRDDTGATSEYRVALAGLATLCVAPNLFETFLIRILSRVERLLQTSEDDPDVTLKKILYAHHLLTTLRVVIDKKAKAQHPDLRKSSSRVIQRIFGMFINGSLATSSGSSVGTAARLIEDAGRIITMLVQQMDERSQRSLLTELQAAFFEGKAQVLSADVITSQIPFKPFRAEAPINQRSLCTLYAHALYAMRPQVLDNIQEVQQICTTVLRLLPLWHQELRLESLCKLLSSLLNKKSETLEPVIETMLSSFWDQHIANVALPLPERRVALSAWAWAMRGLAVRSDSRAYTGIMRILDLFGDDTLSRDAARSMTILSKESDGVLAKENYSVIRLLHRQRFYAFIVPKLVQGYNAAEPGKGTAYLIGLSCLLQSMPKQTSAAELPKLLPLLLRALDLPELDLRANVVDTLAVVVRDRPEVIKGHAGSIVTTLLRMALCENPASDSEAAANLRIAALKCLTVFPDSLDWLTLHQQKHPVLKTLALAVDDPKKRVRKEAVDCRARWYLFKAP